MEPFETIEYRHHTINLHYDEAPHEGPRDWDNLGTMTCFHRNYLLGDKHEMSIDELEEIVQRDDVFALPLYLYDHSGIGMSTSNHGYPFNCPWDAGQVGYIWVEKETVLKEWSRKRMSEKLENQAYKTLRGEVEVYHQHISGQVYGYVIEDENGDHVDSCWGFYGDPEDYMLREAKGMVDHKTDEQVGLIY